ncbi:hypothetical protein KSS87_012538 [Heliosperma pusillum]|nr:hypothetical protein KSS87_012538 [Heliosperma pusillum]
MKCVNGRSLTTTRPLYSCLGVGQGCPLPTTFRQKYRTMTLAKKSLVMYSFKVNFVINVIKDCEFGEDRISGLPDDIILTFLSPMGMKEAAKTSILSKRWRYLWAKRTHLDFNYLCVLPARDPDIGISLFTASEKGKYINWVNQVVGLHCSPCIDTFRLNFDLDSRDAHHFDKWVKFAVSRKVKNLELNSRLYGAFYTPGVDILKLSVGIGDSGITSLTSLHLNRVDVGGDFIEFLLSNCHHLERLYVGNSNLLVRLKVIGLACKLKQLALHSCRKLEELEIDAHDLMYFDYIDMGPSTNLVFRNMPMLVEAAFGGACFESPVFIFHRISHIAAHISKLSLDMNSDKFPAGALPTFCNLKHLNMVVKYNPRDRFDIVRLLAACPVLHELKLEVFWYTYDLGIEAYELKIAGTLNGNDLEVELDYFELRQTERNNYPTLKLLEIVGFGGCSYDVDIILSIMRSAWNLETIICDPHRSDSILYDTYDDDVETSRTRAYKLEKIIPPKISVVII